ncbi:MAG: CHASE4 domain-containing protein [Desulforhopalus sp.]
MRNKTITPPRIWIVQGLALVFLGLTVALLILWIVDCWVIQPVFQELDHKQGLEDNNRVQAAIEDEIASLTSIARDWGYWDDTYQFTETHSPIFIESNYPDPRQFSQNSRVDLFLIYDSKGSELIKGIFDPELDREVRIEEFTEGSQHVSFLIAPRPHSERELRGLMQTRQQGLLLLVAVPILTSEESGPSRGTLIMGRFLSPILQQKIAQKVNVPFQFFTKDDNRLLPSEQKLFTDPAPQTSAFIPKLYGDFIYRIISNIENKPELLLRTPLRGEIKALGRRTGNILSTTLGLIAFVLLIFLAVYRFRMTTSEEALRESEARYRNMFDNKHTVMLLIDPDTNAIIDANAAASLFYGWSPEEMTRLRLSDINIMTEEQLSTEMNLACTEQQTHFLFKHRLADGTVRNVEVYSGPIAFKGKILLLSIVVDITERIRAEEERAQFEARNRQLQKAESLERMAGAIAHLYNNLLSVVIGNLEMVLDDLEKDSLLGAQLSMAMQAAQRSSKISGMMITYLGQPPERYDQLDLSEVCLQFLPELVKDIPKNISVETDLISPGPVVRGNIKQLQQVLLHLITNGWEAIGAGAGQITLSTCILPVSALPKDQIAPTDVTFDAEHFACLGVSDTGCGMTKEAMDSVFDPFFTTKFSGRGLGIPLILGIVKTWGGFVGVESVVDRGTTFRVYLPLIADAFVHRHE